jgi:hypothetical protein
MLGQNVDHRLYRLTREQVFTNDGKIGPHKQASIKGSDWVLKVKIVDQHLHASWRRPLVMVKAIPELVTLRTAARARGVSTLSGVTSAPSTSAITSRTSSSCLVAIELTSGAHVEQVCSPILAPQNFDLTIPRTWKRWRAEAEWLK